MGCLGKEIFPCYNDFTVQPGLAMTVKEMGLLWQRGSPCC